MNNYEWLLQMGGEERQAWFDAQHVDANDALAHKNDVSAASVDANDANDALQLMREFCVADILDALGIDRREKNHTRKMVQALADMVERDYVRRDAEEHVDAPKRSETLRNEQDSREKLEADAIQLAQNIWHQGQNYANGVREIRHIAWQERDIIELLDRQAAITERELCKQCDWPSLAAQPDYESQGRIVALTNKVDELTAERDALADDLLTCNKEREQYRELLSKAIRYAHEIVNLQP